MKSRQPKQYKVDSNIYLPRRDQLCWVYETFYRKHQWRLNGQIPNSLFRSITHNVAGVVAHFDQSVYVRHFSFKCQSCGLQIYRSRYYFNGEWGSLDQLFEGKQ